LERRPSTVRREDPPPGPGQQTKPPGSGAHLRDPAWTDFLTVTRWVSEDAIRAFAGGDTLKAEYYREDKEFLLEFEPQVQHFTVMAGGP
jgi:hypothetical protein